MCFFAVKVSPKWFDWRFKNRTFYVLWKTIIFAWKCLKMALKKNSKPNKTNLEDTWCFFRALNVFVVCKTFWHLNSWTEMKKKNFNCLMINDSHLSVLRLVIHFCPFRSSPPLHLLPSATSQQKQPRKTNFKFLFQLLSQIKTTKFINTFWN